MWEPQPAYRLAVSELHRNLLKQWAAEAVQTGTRTILGEALQTMLYRLCIDPENWGEPLYHYRALKLTLYHASARPVYLEYAVDSVNKIVYLKHLALMSRQESP